YFFFSSRRRHTRSKRDWSSDVCSSDLDWRQGLCNSSSTYSIPPARLQSIRGNREDPQFSRSQSENLTYDRPYGGDQDQNPSWRTGIPGIFRQEKVPGQSGGRDV